MSELPKGCFEHVDHKCIIRKDINYNRPGDQRNVSTERALHHDLIVERRKRYWPFRKIEYWAVLSTTTYEMSGKGNNVDRAWAETDLTGLEWYFHKREDAEAFAYRRN